MNTFAPRRQPPPVASVLPKQAAELLVFAARTRDAQKLDQAIRQVKQQYPQFFRYDKEIHSGYFA